MIMIHWRPTEIVSESPLFLQVPQQDVSLLGVCRATRRVRGVREMFGELILRGVSEQLLSESDEALPPTLGVIQLLRDSELLRLVGSLLSGPSPPAHQDDHEDESASEGHEKNLPPLESVGGFDLCGSGRVDTSDGRQRRYGCRSRRLWDHDQLG